MIPLFLEILFTPTASVLNLITLKKILVFHKFLFGYFTQVFLNLLIFYYVPLFPQFVVVLSRVIILDHVTLQLILTSSRFG